MERYKWRTPDNMWLQGEFVIIIIITFVWRLCSASSCQSQTGCNVKLSMVLSK